MNSILSFRRVGQWSIRTGYTNNPFAAEQVADLLRDKLYIMGTELAEARGRVSELEGLATADRNQSESIALKIRQSGK